ncbi:glycoside hydrolase family 97 C-terminal domain-containing protein [Spirosoma telluris]|uniref:glycoside hydrolase family 97 C-terminal domain-containing protein n=1 Tax=Spirosoma telluris TaxID=2183553 RepID=UPI002FC3D16C
MIHDAIGEYVTIARRSGDDWFVGTITNNDGARCPPARFPAEGEKLRSSPVHRRPDGADQDAGTCVD